MSDKDHHDDAEHDHPGIEPDIGLGYYAARVLAMEELIIEQGLIAEGDVQQMADEIDARSPTGRCRSRGARVDRPRVQGAAPRRPLGRGPGARLRDPP